MSFRSPPPYVKLTSSVGVAVAVLLASVPNTARAGCSYNAADCDDPGHDVCNAVGSVIICDIGFEGGAYNGLAYAVLEDDSGDVCDDTADYCVFGTTSNNAAFCCPVTMGTETSLLIIGTDNSDYISFQYDDVGAYDLDNYTTGFKFEGRVLGEPGVDTVVGSRSTNADYHDDLHGGTGADTISGDLGDDYLAGDDGDDVLYGEEGEDELHGDVGSDELYGGPNDDLIFGGADGDEINAQGGDDTIYAGGGNDNIAGAAGNDTIYGEAGQDDICGDNENDTMYGGDNEDYLWGGLGTEVTTDGQSPTTGDGDHCDTDSSENRTSCETEEAFSGRLADCPTLPGP